ncbi:zinc knuckle [Fusarium albosuccineum]|uniref:Zinc knuckle n=1 Tax=Fusarium albosuccineum TaxID=1237068 RepID=A0A8H4LHA4_9HYPO|nr:zinc knuckle [Fusarium albosuccineum]
MFCLAYVLHFQIALDRPPDIVAIQDPPPEFPWIRSSSYRLIYKTDKELTENDHPKRVKEEQLKKDKLKKDDPKRLEMDRKPIPPYRVCFLVSVSLSEETYHVDFYENANKELTATLFLATPEAGILAIHNVYNRNDTINIEQMLNDTTMTGRDLLVGDFNIHHSQWAGEREVKPTRKAEEMHEGLKEAHMKLVTTPGAGTFSRSPTSEPSTIDLTFVSEGILDCVKNWPLVEAPGFESDHRIIKTLLKIRPTRTVRTRIDWKRTRKKYANATKNNLEPLGFPDLNTDDHIDEYIAKINDAVNSATQDWVPVIRYRTFPRARRPDSASVRTLLAQERLALDKLRQADNSKWERYWSKVKAEREWKQRSEGTTRWRQYTAGQEKYNWGTYQMAKLAKALNQPSKPPHLPDLKVGDIVYQTYCVQS